MNPDHLHIFGSTFHKYCQSKMVQASIETHTKYKAFDYATDLDETAMMKEILAISIDSNLPLLVEAI